MPERTAQPLSPELILVSPPDVAARAREQLPDPRREPIVTDSSDAAWNDFLADVRNRPVEPVVTPRTIARPPVRIRRNGRERLLVGLVALVGVGAVVGVGWARDRGHRPPGSGASSRPAAPAPEPAKPSSHDGSGFMPTRVWSWAAASGTGAYVVRFLRDGRRVLTVRTGSPRLRLPSTFTFEPGSYRWTVTAIPRNGKSGRVIVDSAFTVS